MDPKVLKQIEETSYKLAQLLNQAACEACDRRDTNAVHYFVTEERKFATLPNYMKRRFGIN